jgi:hypothetical protein
MTVSHARVIQCFCWNYIFAGIITTTEDEKTIVRLPFQTKPGQITITKSNTPLQQEAVVED